MLHSECNKIHKKNELSKVQQSFNYNKTLFKYIIHIYLSIIHIEIKYLIYICI